MQSQSIWLDSSPSSPLYQKSFCINRHIRITDIIRIVKVARTRKRPDSHIWFRIRKQNDRTLFWFQFAQAVCAYISWEKTEKKWRSLSEGCEGFEGSATKGEGSCKLSFLVLKGQEIANAVLCNLLYVSQQSYPGVFSVLFQVGVGSGDSKEWFSQ